MAKNFVVQNINANKLIWFDAIGINHNNIKLKIQGKFLLEILIITSILAFLYCSYDFNSFLTKKNQYKNYLKLKQLQQALYFARSEAIKLQNKVYLCPSLNLRQCSNNWTNKIIIFVKNTDQNIKVLSNLETVFNDTKIKIRFFGNKTNTKIVFLPNGTTINNGHFCINNEAICLYLNQAGKIYIIDKK